MSLIYVGLVLQSALALTSTIPPDAQKVLNALPDKAITLDMVLAKSMSSSDSFEQVKSQFILTEVAGLGARAAYDPRFTLKYDWSDNRHEVSNAFMPSQFKSDSYGLGIRTLLPTGTAFSFDLSTGSNAFNIATNSVNYFESRAVFAIEQSLWANAFGRASRRNVEAGMDRDRATTAMVRDSVENWSLGMMRIFYDAWLAKTRHQAMVQNVKRRERLERILRIKTRRGTSEEPDLLQVKSALIGAKVQEAEAHQALIDRWQGLVVTLKLPRSWLEIDPAVIPINIDDPVTEALRICQKPPSALTEDNAPAGVRRLRADARAAENKFLAVRSQSQPDLKLKASAASNGIDANTRAQTLDETRDYKNPAYFLGLEFSMPLLSRQNEAEYRTALAEKTRTQAAARMGESQWELDWMANCASVQRLAKTQSDLREALQFQDRRARLDERRFEIGRSSILSVVQAGDEATAAELNLRGTEVQARMAAWTVRRQNDGLDSYLRRIEKMEFQGL